MEGPDDNFNEIPELDDVIIEPLSEEEILRITARLMRSITVIQIIKNTPNN